MLTYECFLTYQSGHIYMGMMFSRTEWLLLYNIIENLLKELNVKEVKTVLPYRRNCGSEF